MSNTKTMQLPPEYAKHRDILGRSATPYKIGSSIGYSGEFLPSPFSKKNQTNRFLEGQRKGMEQMKLVEDRRLRRERIMGAKGKSYPGPWEVLENSRGETCVSLKAGYRTVCLMRQTNFDVEKMKSSAFLIAAAPDLLASLEEVTAELSQMHSHYHPACEGGCPTVEYIMNARKAIAKANGG